MRDFTKSFVSAGLASTLFGVRQVTNVLGSTRTGEAGQASEAFNNVAHAMADQCGDSLRETFHTADKIQREVIDLTSRFWSQDAPANAPTATWTGIVNQVSSQLVDWFSRSGDQHRDTDPEQGWSSDAGVQ